MEELTKRIETLEKENEELKKILKDVAELAYFAYNDMKFSTSSNREYEIRLSINQLSNNDK